MRRFLAFVITAAVVMGIFVAAASLRPRLTPAERGRRLAEVNGCFSCHGPGGTRGVPNAGRADGAVPSFGSLMMYARDEEQVREWIRDGVTKAKASSKTWRAERDRGVLRMPAYGHRLTSREIADLAAYVRAVAGEPAPEDSLAAAGYDRAAALGCFGCHGAGARLARPNPGSFKGYVPPWDGPDFPELVRDRGEFREWVEDGVSRRFAANPAARFFLRRAPLRMPAYRKHLAPGDLDAMWKYATWLRGGIGATTMGP
jgi:mono/diheme cytochrome c family protein